MRTIATALLAMTLLMPALLYAEQNDQNKPTFPATNWVSKNSTDAVSIQNGAGTAIMIVINVSDQSPHANGVNVSNCGSTTYIKAGSSTVCETNDSQNAVTLTSDSTDLPASGTYQLKQQ